jgi:hypothetical protein
MVTKNSGGYVNIVVTKTKLFLRKKIRLDSNPYKSEQNEPVFLEAVSHHSALSYVTSYFREKQWNGQKDSHLAM